MRTMGRVRHEILYVQAAEVFGRLCQGHIEHVSQGLTACPGVHHALPGTAAPGLEGTKETKKAPSAEKVLFSKYKKV